MVTGYCFCIQKIRSRKPPAMIHVVLLFFFWGILSSSDERQELFDNFIKFACSFLLFLKGFLNDGEALFVN